MLFDPPSAPPASLDHMSVFVKTLSEASQALQKLGFTFKSWGRFPGGLENGGLLFADGSYLEFVAPYDLEKAKKDPDYASLNGAERADGFGLHTNDAHAELDFLTSKGLPVELEENSSFQEPGKPKPTTWLWRLVTFTKEAPAGDPFWIQYSDQDPKKSLAPQPNTLGAQGLFAVWIAVKDVKASAAQFAAAGIPTQSIRPDQALLKLTKGYIVLTTGRDNREAQDSFQKFGAGIYRVSFACPDVHKSALTCQDLLKRRVRPQHDLLGDSLLLPADLTPGIRIDLTQGSSQP